MTQTHNIFRLRWMLKDASAEQRMSVSQALNELALLKGTRAELKAKLAQLQAGSDKVLAEAAKDIDITLVEIPDSSLTIDWSRLCREMAGDLSVGPEKTLANLDAIRQQILKVGNALRRVALWLVVRIGGQRENRIGERALEITTCSLGADRQ